MMIKTIRKAVSILCVAAVLMSLVVVAFTGTTSAFKASDPPSGSALKLTFDNSAGVALQQTGDQNPQYVSDPGNSANRVYKAYYKNSNGSQEILWSPGKTADSAFVSGAQAVNADVYQLKPATTYKVSFRFRLGQTTCGLAVGRAEQSIELRYGTTKISDATQEIVGSKQYIAFDAGKYSKLSSGKYRLRSNMDWMEYSYVFKTPDVLSADRLYVRGFADNTYTVYFDDFMIDVVDETAGLGDLESKKVFNGVKDGTSDYWAPNNENLLAGNVDAKGYHLNATQNDFNNGLMAPVSRKAVMAVYDPDHGYVQMKQGARYLVSVKYKMETIGAAGENYTALCVGYSADSNAPGAEVKTGIAQFGTKYSMATVGEGYSLKLGDWDILEAVIEGSSYVDKYLYLVVENYDASTMTIESITVSELRNTSGAVAIKYDTLGGNAMMAGLFAANKTANLPIPTHSNADLGFAGWFFDAECTQPVPSDFKPTADITVYSKWVNAFSRVTFVNNGKETTKRLAVGLELPKAERPVFAAFFEAWCTDKKLTQEIKTVPSEDITVYARYNIVYTEFNQGGASDKWGSDAAEIVADPEDPSGKNKVLSHHAASNANMLNFEVGMTDLSGVGAFTLKPNTTYNVSFKVKAKATEAAINIYLYSGAQSTASANASKSLIGTAYSFPEGSLKDKDSEWIPVSTSFTTGESLYKERVNWTWQDKLYFCFHTKKTGDPNANMTKDVYIYIDDLMVIPSFSEVPEGAVGVFFETNSEELAPVIGYAGEKIMMPDDPTLAGYKFAGWYTDKQFKNKFKSTVYPDKNLTLYAKWEMTQWVMDFDSGYYNATISGRFNLETKDGNTYLRYNYEQGKKVSNSKPEEYGRATFNNGKIAPYYGTEGVTYTVKLKYKVIEASTSTGIKGISSQLFNTWTNGIVHSGGITFNANSKDWQEATFSFTPSGMYSANALGFSVNGDSTVLLDDFVITADINVANVYGGAMYMFNGNGGDPVDAIGGDPGEKVYLPKTKRANYIFKGWYTDSSCSKKFTDTVFGEDNMTLYAGWALRTLTENFEDLPATVQVSGVSGTYDYYTNRIDGFDKANVHSGDASIFRKGSAEGTKGFTVCRDGKTTLDVGSEYTISFYVKPTNVTDAAGTINIIALNTSNGITSPVSTESVTAVGNLAAGEWQKVTHTFTAKAPYLGISTTAGNDIYFDTVELNINGYVGTDTGDSSVSPVIITLMVLIACGALVVTGRKVFDK